MRALTRSYELDCAKLVVCFDLSTCPTFWASLGAGLSILLSAIGAGLGIGISGPAIAGAGDEKPEVKLKTFIATILVQVLALYGLLVGLLFIFALPALTTIERG